MAPVKPQSFRQSATLAFFFTLIWGTASHAFSSESTILGTALSLPVFFAIILLTMRATNRLSLLIFARFGRKPVPPPPPLAPSTDRPEHVSRRRRERRRRRANGRR
jgi:hypothetical protein